MLTRLSKIIIVSAIALYASLVAFNNITDYYSNFVLVQHVLTMDTTFPDNKGLWRAIDVPLIHHIVYGFIIVTEIAIAGLCAVGSAHLYQNIQHATAFNQSKRLAIIGLTLGLMLWFTGFMTIGGEWFLMWQSEVANGQQAAFRLVMIMSAALIFLTQHDDDRHA